MGLEPYESSRLRGKEIGSIYILYSAEGKNHLIFLSYYGGWVMVMVVFKFKHLEIHSRQKSPNFSGQIQANSPYSIQILPLFREQVRLLILYGSWIPVVRRKENVKITGGKM